MGTKRTKKEIDTRRAKHATYMRSYNERYHINGGYHKTPKNVPENKFLYTGLKYAHLIDEPVNQGKNYTEYRALSKKKTLPIRQKLLTRLKAERKERIKKFGKLDVPKVAAKMWVQFKTALV